MRNLLLLIAALTFTISASAQDKKEVKNTKVVIVNTNKVETKNYKEVKLNSEVVRVHKNRNYKVIKALNFSTKKRSLMA